MHVTAELWYGEGSHSAELTSADKMGLQRNWYLEDAIRGDGNHTLTLGTYCR